MRTTSTFRSVCLPLSVFLISTTTSLNGEADTESSVALKGGGNTATLTKGNQSNRYGVSGGLSGYLQWPTIGHFSIAGQADLLYSPRGAKVISMGDYLGQSRQHYLDGTISARPELRVGPASLYLLLGGGINLLMSATTETASGISQNITGDLNRIDISLLGAAGIALHLPDHDIGPFNLGTVFLELRHDIGLLDTYTTNSGYKNRASSLMLGLSLRLGRSSPHGMVAE